jgi:hypothetical protein
VLTMMLLVMKDGVTFRTRSEHAALSVCSPLAVVLTGLALCDDLVGRDRASAVGACTPEASCWLYDEMLA